MDKDSLLARKLYDNQFIRYFEKQTEYKVIQDLRKRINFLLGDVKNKEILFAGCGDGRECLSAIKKGARVTGMDISKNCIDLAKRNCRGLRTEFIVGDFEKTNFKNGRFDIVTAIFSVMYKKNLGSVLKEFSRILKKKGALLVVVPHPIRKMIKYNEMNYFVNGKKFEVWKGNKRFNYYRILEDYVNSIVGARLKITKLLEPKLAKD
ncbi:MAG: class I SAM-dependent methyltransferase [Nanoarchaeota archaeon]|nr:class I SAM-dependent methyltransferase [Nanoarchaeota archaeon]MBU0977174.1 class I SAM-dependent methyltransferase [Nanoarchaeota archaeon]